MSAATMNMTNGSLQAKVERELQWDQAISFARIGVSVKEHAVTLSGMVDSLSSRLAGDVTHVKNNITFTPQRSTQSIHNHIVTALERYAVSEAKGINVASDRGEVTLSGSVPSGAKRDCAESAARAAPGVTVVRDHVSFF